MQQAIPYSNGRTWMPLSSPTGVRAILSTRSSPYGIGNGNGTGSSSSATASAGNLGLLVNENPVLILGRKGCCMCHVVRRLLLGLGVNPAVCELDDGRDEASLMEELRGVMALQPDDGSRVPVVQFPAVFIGGRHVGGLDRLMAAHISGDLVPILKQAGALWL